MIDSFLKKFRSLFFNYFYLILILIYYKCDYCFGDESDENVAPSENFYFVKYLYYNQYKVNDPDIVMTTMNGSFPNFDYTLPTKIIIHGYNSDCNEQFAIANKNAILKWMNANVICVDWSSMSNTGILNAMQGIHSTTNILAVLIENLQLDMKKLHIIGHSFGAHIAGLTSRKLLVSGFDRIAHITGLDPALVFIIHENTTRLDKTCADLVDVVHTSSLGVQIPLGHFDFFPNGGLIQPGCDQLVTCSHSRSHQLFAESLANPWAFPTYRCTSLMDVALKTCDEYNQIFMGNLDSYDRDRLSKEGIYYVNTKDTEPYSPLEPPNISLLRETSLTDFDKFLRLHSFGLYLWTQRIYARI